MNDKPAHLLACGLCYEEDEQEVHPNPECVIGYPSAAGAPRPASTVWTLEGCYDSDGDKWHGIGGTYADRDEAMDVLKRRAENDSDFVKHCRFHVVRATTTYTVEAEYPPPPVHRGGNADDCPACQAQGLHTIGHPYECPGSEK